MKRTYRRAEAIPVEGGYGVALDGKPISTPARRPVAVPSRALAEAMAAEWEAQTDEIRAHTMPLMQLAATAIDRIADRRDAVIEELAAYAATDLLCYRAEHPAELTHRQAQVWQPLLDWVSLRFDAPLLVTSGVLPKPQDPAALSAIRSAIAERTSWELSALGLATHACGSIVLGLALLEGKVDAEAAWQTSLVDELYQAEFWGEDEQAVARRGTIRGDIHAAADFLRLLHEG